MQQLYGIVKLDPHIVCSKDVLGSSVPIVVGGVPGQLELPHAPDWSVPSKDLLRDPLRPPDAAQTWKSGDKPMRWGRPVSSPSCVSEVERMLLRFELPESEMHGSATRVHRGYGKWWSLFNDYLELVTRQRRLQSVQVEGDNSNFDLFRWGADGKADRPYDRDPQKIVIRVSSDDVALTPVQLTRVATFASTSTELAIELKVQLEAYRALGAGDYRKAIIETAVAAEVALTKLIQSALLTAQIGYADKLLEKFRMLGGRLELARIVGVHLPQIDFQLKLVNPRNDVIHRADFANETSARQAIMATDELLLLLWPSMWARI